MVTLFYDMCSMERFITLQFP